MKEILLTLIVFLSYLLSFVVLLDPRKDDNRAIQKKTKQLVDIVEQRNALVELLDEERKRYVGLGTKGL